MHPLVKYISKRLIISVLTIAGVVVFVFFVARILPGDPAAARAGEYATEETLQRLRENYGLDRPLLEQFVDYVGNVIFGNFGRSIQTDQPVTGELLRRLPATLELALASLFLALAIGLPLGIVAAVKRDTWVDALVRLWAIAGSSMALFWLGLLLIFVFFFQLQWLPGPVGRLPFAVDAPERITGLYTVDALLSGEMAVAVDAIRHMALPVITLGFVVTAPIIKIVRGAMIKVLDSDYIRAAKVVGVPKMRLLFVDGLRNAMLPILTSVGLVFGYMLGGNVIVEFLFSWPGIGRYAYRAVQTNDLEALQGFVILVGIMYVFLNLVIDVLYAWIDPRIKLGGQPR